MFRATTCAFNVRALLSRCQLIDHHIVSISRFPTNHVITPGDPRARAPCPVPKPPPKKSPKDAWWFWGSMTLIVIAGAGIVVAKESKELRDWLTLYAPWVDDIIAVATEENMSYGEFASACIEDVKRLIDDWKHPKQCRPDGTLIKEVSEKPHEIIGSDGEPKPCELEPPPVYTQGITEMEKCMQELSEFIINNYNTAKDACAYYNSLVDETMNTFTMKDIKTLSEAQQERECLVNDSLQNACNAILRLDKMAHYLDCGVQATKEEINYARMKYHRNADLQRIACIKYQWENDKALAKDEQWKAVVPMVEKYARENQSLFSRLDYNSDTPSLEGDVDIILYNTYRYVNNLTEELKEASEAMRDRVNRAYDMLPRGEGGLKLVARDAELATTLAKRRLELENEYKQRYEEQKINNANYLKSMTAKQIDKHENLLETRLKQKEEQVRKQLNKMVDDKVQAEKRVFAAKLADMRYNLELLEQKLEARLRAERETRRSQELWAAAQALLAATKKGDPYININNELNAIEKASGGEDKLVLTVLRSIPASVREKGVVPESVLRQKYEIMERTALRVAMVEENGNAMPVYLLSWVQSLLLFMKMPGIPQSEYDNPPKEPSKYLDTFDLLQRARFWLQEGNLAQALSYIKNLKGASRMVSVQWLDAAREHLEVRQAAEAVLAHAAAMGLQYV